MSTNRSTLLDKTPASPSTSDLCALFNGRVIAPDDPRYKSARTVFYGGIDRRPSAIIRAAVAGDISRLVKLAGEHGIELAIRSSGHSVAGHSITEGGIVLDLSAMKDLQIDLEAGTAWAQAGLTAGEFTTAVGAHGPAVGFGDTGSVFPFWSTPKWEGKPRALDGSC
jgi:FAD/FMN-containing dehydrogenase